MKKKIPANCRIIEDRYFLIKKDGFGLWCIWSCYDDNFKPIVGCPAFSVGHARRKDAQEFLNKFETIS